MSYSQFTFSQLKKSFNLTINQETNLFSDVNDIEVGDFLKKILKENVPLATAIHTEKARSEMIVVPILIELRKQLKHQISLFSGIEFDVDKDKGLNGTCDYLISISKEQLYVTAPLITVVEAKNDNIKSGLPQCLAEMIASKIFNAQEKNNIKTIYGIVTTGTVWKFLKLEDEDIAYIDLEEYHIGDIDKIMGILLQMVKMESK